METISAEEVFQISHQVWSTMLEFDLRLASAGDALVKSHTVVGTISLNGDWKGGVVLQFSDPLARAVASHIFMMEGEEVAPEDIRDAVGELTNQVGGLIKSRLAPQSLLSLPTIAEGTAVMVDIPGCKPIGTAEMESKDSPVKISVWKYIPSS